MVLIGMVGKCTHKQVIDYLDYLVQIPLYKIQKVGYDDACLSLKHHPPKKGVVV